ncbi:MAG TPA: hypothetical protein VM537_31695, partial [Anaerolineae bacterium]|nr:hypothetical protein [Anaerolineae bacterium]
WLAQFIDVVGECWRNRDMMDISILAGILPNQNGALVSPTDLRRDGGIPEELKDICAGIGIDLRARLLTNELGAVADRNGLAFAPGVLTEAVPGEHTEDQTLEECVKKLESDLPEGSRDLDKRASAVAGSVRLLGYLWRTRGNNGGELAARIPLVTAENSVARWSRDRMLMAPVPRWHEGARGFSAAYPPGRILREDYGCSLAEDETDVVQALCAWGILHADPLTTQRPVELKDRRLAAIAVERAQTEGVTVAGQELSQIALLQPEVLNRCQEGPEEAAALLGLVLCYIAPTDKGWRTKLSALGRKGGQDARVDLWGALWLADLRFRSWVPVEDDGQYSKMTANMATLSTLVKSEWLAGNNAAVQLLSTWFGFDELELRLMATAPDLADRTRLKNELAGLVEVAGGAPGLYRTLAEQIVEQSRRSQQVERCRQFGLAVQEAVREALEARGLHLELVDRGFDYEVSAAMDAGDPMVDGAYRLSVGRYLLEVKATTTGQVRLTPAQAAAASGNVERYVLCVVDLRSVTPERLDKAWNARDVEPITKLIDGIGLPVQETRGLVAQAVARPVGIRNETALRYQVAESVWSAGCSMTAWVEQIGAEQLSGPDGTACSGYSALKPP